MILLSMIFLNKGSFTRYEPPVTRYSCDSPSPLHHAVAAQRVGGSPSVLSPPLSVLPTFPPSHFPNLPQARLQVFMAMLKYKKHFVDYLFTLRNTIANV